MEDTEEFPEENLGVPEKAIIHLYNSVERLNFSITKLLNLFETAKIEPEQNHAGKIILKVKEVAIQNEKIAKGIISLANIVKEQTSVQPDYEKIVEKLERLEMLMQTSPQSTEDYQNIIRRLEEMEEQLQKMEGQGQVMEKQLQEREAQGQVMEEQLQKRQMQSPFQMFQTPEQEPIEKLQMEAPIQRIPLKQKMPLRRAQRVQPVIQEPEFMEPRPNRRMDASAPPAFRGIGEPARMPQEEQPGEDLGEFKFSEEPARRPDIQQETVPDMPHAALEGLEELDIPMPPPRQKSFLSKLKK